MRYAPLVSFLMASLCAASAAEAGDVGSDKQPLLAFGQPARSSAPATPNIQPSPGTDTSTKAAPLSPSELFPRVSPAAIEQGDQKATQEAEQTKAPNAVTIEYNEEIQPLSNQGGLSVVQALNEALIKGPRAAAVRAQFAIARANYPAATQAPNPILFLDRGLAAEQVNRLGPDFTWDPPWKLIFRLLIAKRMVAQSKIDLMTQIWSLRHDARAAYIELVVAQETQKTLIQLYELNARLLTVSEKRYQAGDVPQLDVLKAKLSAASSEVDVGVGAKRVTRARQQLNILMGRPPEGPVSVPALPAYTSEKPRVELRAEKSDILPDFSRPVPPLKDFINIAFAHRLELQSLAMQVKVNNANLAGAYGNVIPDPNFTTGKSTAGNPNAGPKLTAVFMTLSQELPISNTNQGAIWQYKATGNQLKYQILAQRNQILADVSSAYNNLLAARKKLKVYQDRLLSDSNEVARLARRSYESGQSDITATLQALQANVQVRNAYLDAVNSYGSAFTDLEFAVGKPLQ